MTQMFSCKLGPKIARHRLHATLSLPPNEALPPPAVVSLSLQRTRLHGPRTLREWAEQFTAFLYYRQRRIKD